MDKLEKSDSPLVCFEEGYLSYQKIITYFISLTSSSFFLLLFLLHLFFLNQFKEASIYSRCVLWYLNPIFKKGATSILEQKDLGGISQMDKCETLTKKVSELWNEELKLPVEKR